MKWIWQDPILAYRAPEIKGLVLKHYAARWIAAVSFFLMCSWLIPAILVSIVLSPFMMIFYLLLHINEWATRSRKRIMRQIDETMPQKERYEAYYRGRRS